MRLDELSKTFKHALDNFDEGFECPYGDGNSSSKVLEAIDYYMEYVK